MADLTTASHARYLATKRFGSLDGLRCVAIIPVVWHHCTRGPLAGPLGRGPLGVDLFFAISGFLITTLLLRERDATRGIGVGGFYARRALRIFPLYYAVLALYVVNAALFMADAHRAQRDHFFRSLPFFATYTTNWFVDFDVPHPVSFSFSWSLAAEEQFYLVWPWVIAASGALTHRARRCLLPACIAMLLLGLGQGAAHGSWITVLPADSLARRMAVSIASPICMGALCALLLHAPLGFSAARRVLGAPWSAPAAFAAVVLSACLDGVPLWLAQALMAVLVASCAVRSDHWIAWLLDAPPLRWVGTVSYGMYLFHVSLIAGMRRVLPPEMATPALTFAVVLPATIAAASASYVWVERPLLRLRVRFAVGARGPSSPRRDPSPRPLRSGRGKVAAAPPA